MRSLFRIMAFVILAAWLPATQHCAMAAAGLIAPEAEHAQMAVDCRHTDHCNSDGCKTVESSLVKPVNDTGKVPLPAITLASSLYLFCVQLLALEQSSEPTLSAETVERPLDWVPTWQFVRRAAPLSRAPSFVG